MARPAVRWIGAFNQYASAPNWVEACTWETTQRQREVAAAVCCDATWTSPAKAPFGLIARKCDIVRTGQGDVWSVVRHNGRLKPNRGLSLRGAVGPKALHVSKGYSEVFLRRGWTATGILFANGTVAHSRQGQEVVGWAKAQNLEIFILLKGGAKIEKYQG